MKTAVTPISSIIATSLWRPGKIRAPRGHCRDDFPTCTLTNTTNRPVKPFNISAWTYDAEGGRLGAPFGIPGFLAAHESIKMPIGDPVHETARSMVLCAMCPNDVPGFVH